MPGTMGTILQTLYMLGVVALFPAVEGLRRDIEVHNTITPRLYLLSFP